MRQKKIPKILIIAGSDSGGGAGIQSKIKNASFFKVFATTAITAVTSQNTFGVQSIHHDTYLVTPNSFEAEILTGIKIESLEQQKQAAREIKKLGTKNVLVKGGHVNNGKSLVDILINEKGDLKLFKSERIESKNTHGTGCTLSTAIASNIANKVGLEKAITESISYVQKGIKNAPDFGTGKGPLLHFDV